MAVSKFTDAALVRDRTAVVDIGVCDVYIGSGAPDALTEFDTLAEIAAAMESTGVNSADSPDWKFEPVLEDVDYEKNLLHYAATTILNLKKVNQALLDFCEDDLTGAIATIVCVPVGAAAGDTVFVIENVKLFASGAGKGNSTETSVITLTCEKKVKNRSDIYNIVTLTG